MKKIKGFFVFIFLWICACALADNYLASISNAWMMAYGWLVGSVSFFAAEKA